MRHGIPWWETFWKWLLDNLPWVDIGDYDLTEFLEMKKKEFEEKWREGTVTIPPKEVTK